MIVVIYILFFLLPVASIDPIPHVGIVSLFDLLFFPLFFYWLVVKLLKKKLVLKKTAFSLSFVIMFLASIIASFLAEHPFGSFFGFLLMLRYYFFFHLLIDLIDNIHKLNNAVYAFSLSMIIISIIGIAQHYLHFNIHLNPGQEFEINSNAQFRHLGNVFTRTTGTFHNSLNFGMYLSSGFMLLAFSPKFGKLLKKICCIVVMVSLIYTVSRAAMVITFFCILLYSFVYSSKRYVYWILAPISIVLALTIISSFSLESFLPESISGRFMQLEQYQEDMRYPLWLSAAEGFGDHIFGVGYKNANYTVDFPHRVFLTPNYKTNQTPGWHPFNFHFENVYLACYMNLGILGFAGFMTIVFNSIYEPLKVYKRATPEAIKKAAIMILFFNTSLLLNMITNPSILGDYRLMLLFWIGLSFVVILNNILKRQY